MCRYFKHYIIMTNDECIVECDQLLKIFYLLTNPKKCHPIGSYRHCFNVSIVGTQLILKKLISLKRSYTSAFTVKI